MADIVDMAQDGIIAAHEAVQAHARLKKAVPGRTDCRECGEVIEPARRTALPSAATCTYCQTQIEERSAR